MDITSYLLGKQAGSGGGGATINGVLQNKTLASNVEKGDIVARGVNTVSSYLSSTTKYQLSSNSTILNPEYLIDGNDNTYTQITAGSGMPRIYFIAKNNIELGIADDDKILNFEIEYKIGDTSISSGTRKVAKMLFDDGLFNSSLYTSISGGTKNYTDTTSFPLIDTIDFNNNHLSIYGKDLEYYGGQIYFAASHIIQLYYIKFNITYETDGKVKTITSDADTVVGVANESGTIGDIIEVYVPNIQQASL